MSQTACYPEKAPTTNRVLEVLSHNLRREVIHYFENIESAESATLEDLTAHIAQRAPRTTGEEVSVQLYHTHLPKLDSNDWVEWDTHTQSIRYCGHDQAEALLAELAEMLSEDPYSSHPD